MTWLVPWTRLTGGDVAISVNPDGTEKATITSLQGRALSPAAPASNDALVWDATAKQWKPHAVVGGGPNSDLPLVSDVRISGRDNTVSFILDRSAPAGCYIQIWRAAQTPFGGTKKSSPSYNAFKAVEPGGNYLGFPIIPIPPNTKGVLNTGHQFHLFFRPPLLPTGWARGSWERYYRESNNRANDPWPSYVDMGVGLKRRNMVCLLKFGTVTALQGGRKSLPSIVTMRIRRWKSAQPKRGVRPWGLLVDFM